MSEIDISGRVDGKHIPNPRQPQRRASLYDVLSATAQHTAETASTVVGTTVPRRVAGFVQELNTAMGILANKWGVDPRRIPMQRDIPIRRELPQRGRVVFVNQNHERGVVAYKLTDKDREKIRKSLPTHLSDRAESLLMMAHSGRAVAALLLKKGMSQEVLGGLIGKSKSAVDKGSRGIRPFKLSVLHAICDALEIPEEDDRREVLIKMAIEEERQRAIQRASQIIT